MQAVHLVFVALQLGKPSPGSRSTIASMVAYSISDSVSGTSLSDRLRPVATACFSAFASRICLRNTADFMKKRPKEHQSVF